MKNGICWMLKLSSIWAQRCFKFNISNADSNISVTKGLQNSKHCQHSRKSLGWDWGKCWIFVITLLCIIEDVQISSLWKDQFWGGRINRHFKLDVWHYWHCCELIGLISEWPWSKLTALDKSILMLLSACECLLNGWGRDQRLAHDMREKGMFAFGKDTQREEGQSVRKILTI